FFVFFFSSKRRHTRSKRDWSSDVCSSDLKMGMETELTILMNSTDRYYYEKVDTKQKQTEGERLSNFIIEPLFVMEDSYKRVKYRSEERRVGKEGKSWR